MEITTVTTGEASPTPATPTPADPATPAPETPVTEATLELAKEAGAATQAAQNASQEAREAEYKAETARDEIKELREMVVSRFDSITSELGNLREKVMPTEKPETSPADATPTTTASQDGDAEPVVVDAPPADIPATKPKARGFWAMLLGTRPTT